MRKLRLLLLYPLMVSASIHLSAQVSIPAGSSFKYLKGSSATSMPANWNTSGFDDSSWLSAEAPFHYGRSETQGTELTDMQHNYTTLFLRKKFTVEKIDSIRSVTIGTYIDDGYAIWINGVFVDSLLAPASLVNQSIAQNFSQLTSVSWFNGDSFQNKVYDTKDLPLIEGENVIAVCCLNQKSESSDFYFDIQITCELEIDDIEFSYPSGFYSNNFSLQISHPDPEYRILYTVDGSNPVYSGTRIAGGYGQTVTVNINPASTYSGVRGLTPGVVIRASVQKSGFDPLLPTSRTYIYTGLVKTQGNPGTPWPTNDEDDWVNNQSMYYDMATDVTGDNLYKDSIEIALKDIPTLSVVIDNDSLFERYGGIYVNAENSGREWERNCSFELINPDGTEGFAVNAGLRIRGRASRGDNVPKHSFRLFFRSEYGNGKLKYPLFGDEGVDKFDKVDLRTAQNYSWHFSNSEHNTFVREVFARDAQRDAGQPYTRSRYYHLYLNGMYWGIYQTQERSEARFSADYLGGTSDDYDVIKMSNEGNTSEEEHMIAATDGTLDKWREVYNRTLTGFASDKNYFALEGKDEKGNMDKDGEVLVDIDNLIDYMMNIFYTGNFDSPITKWAGNDGANKWINNMYAVTNREDRLHGFKFYIHDAEHAMFVGPPDPSLQWIPGIGLYENRVNIGDDTIPLDERMTVDQFEHFHPQWLHHKLCANAEYKQRFADRAMHQLTGNGIWTPERNRERFNNRAGQIDKAIIAESARWGDYKPSQYTWKDVDPYTKYNAWLPELNDIRDNYFPYRTDILIDQLTAAGLYSTLDAPLFKTGNTELPEINDLTSAVSIKVENTNNNGTIYYTTDGSDPRTIGGTVASGVNSVVSGNTISISESVNINARVFYENKWSGVKKISFVKEQVDFSMLKVTEVHYHPLDEIDGLDTIDDSKYEFIEFKNTSTETMNLTGLVIDSAIYYEFPDNTLLGAGEFYVVAAKPSYFFDRYGVLPSGNFSNKLSNGGEQVVVYKKEGNVIIDFTYDDKMPWPTQPDGGGVSLVAVEENPTGNPAFVSYWTSSAEVHGNPFGYGSGVSAVEQAAEVSDIMVYPNPTDNILYINTENLIDVNVSVFDINGRMYYAGSVYGDGSISFAEANLTYGVYFVRLESANGIEVKKVLYTPY